MLADVHVSYPTLILIHNQNGKILWREQALPKLEALIKQQSLKRTSYHELESNVQTSNEVLKGNT